MSGPRLLRRDPLAVPVPAGLVDAHVHVTPGAPDATPPAPDGTTPDGTAPDGPAGPVVSAAQPDLSPGDAAAALRALGGAWALACPPRADGYAATNAAMLRACRLSGGALAPAARLGGVVPVLSRSPWAVRRALRSRVVARGGGRPSDLPGGAGGAGLDGFVAVTLAPHLDGVPGEDVLAEIRARRLPVVVHAGAACPPSWVARHLLPRLGGAPVVLAHLGALPASAEDLADAVALAREGRVWLDTAAAWLAEFVALAVRQAPGRVLFASASPYLAPRVAWAHVATSVTDDGALAHLAGDAAREVFGQPDQLLGRTP